MSWWTPLFDAALVSVLGTGALVWALRNHRRDRRLTHTQVDRLQRDFASAPFGRDARWDGER